MKRLTSSRCKRLIRDESRHLPGSRAAACGAAVAAAITISWVIGLPWTPTAIASTASPTTAPFGAAGPEDPEGGIFGQVAPTSFMIGDVPVSYDFTATRVGWSAWGSARATGTGHVRFGVIMSPVVNSTFTMTLTGRVRVGCRAGTHYSYTRMRFTVADYEGRRSTGSDVMHPGCAMHNGVSH